VLEVSSWEARERADMEVLEVSSWEARERADMELSEVEIYGGVTSY